jgi:ribosomal protein S27E
MVETTTAEEARESIRSARCTACARDLFDHSGWRAIGERAALPDGARTCTHCGDVMAESDGRRLHDACRNVTTIVEVLEAAAPRVKRVYGTGMMSRRTHCALCHEPLTEQERASAPHRKYHDACQAAAGRAARRVWWKSTGYSATRRAAGRA